MVEIRAANIYVKHEIININIFEGAEIEIEDALEIIGAYLDLTSEQSYPVLTDARGLRFISPEAKRAFSSPSFSKKVIANAIVAQSLPVILVANFFIRFYKPLFPIRLFSSKEKALEWLSNFKQARINS